MEKLSLGPNHLMKINDRLIYTSLTGYGHDGPMSNAAGHDINYLSMYMNKRINRVKVSLGGAIKRKNPSKASLLYNKLNLINGRVLDYGCGYGLDAKVNKWESYDPYYNDIKLDGLYDTIVCTNVLSAVSLSLLFELYKLGNLFFVSDATTVSSTINCCLSNSFSNTALLTS